MGIIKHLGSFRKKLRQLRVVPPFNMSVASHMEANLVKDFFFGLEFVLEGL